MSAASVIPVGDEHARVVRAAGPGPTVVLVHGASGSADAWGPTLPAWDWADLWCPDLPGRGAPSAPRATVSGLADWLADLSRACEWRAPVVVGHSLGGAIALQLALDHPDRVGAVVMVASGSRLRVAPAILEAVAASTPESPVPLDFAFPAGADPAAIASYNALAASTPPEAALADWRACDGFDVRHRLAELRIPLLVVHGDADPLTPARFQRLLAEAVPGATRVELPGLGHMLPWEDPAALSRVVSEWLAAR